MTKLFLVIFIASAGDVRPIIGGAYLSETACMRAGNELMADVAAQGVPVDAVTSICIDSGLVVLANGEGV